MKVLQINSVCGVGSTGRIATDLHSILKEEGHESYIAYGRGESRNCDSAIRIGSNLGNYMHIVKTRLFDKHGLGSEYATKKLIKKIDEINPDIIHLHNIHGYYINIKILFSYLKKIDKPIVWTLHDCWPFTGHCSYFDYAGCKKWKRECHKCTQKKTYPTSIGIDRSKKNFQVKRNLFTDIKNMVIITPSQWLGNLVKDSFLKEYPVKVINNGIDLEIFKPTQSNFRDRYQLKDKYIILGVASVWDKRKGLKYFVEMEKKLEGDAKIILVGVTDEQKDKLPKNILGITKTNNAKELAEIYSAANVFINPTLEDNFPTTNLEALACGTPVVTFNTGGSIESIKDGCGKVVNKESLDQLVEVVGEFQTKKNTSEMCRDISKEYDKNTIYKQYIDVYEGMIKEK